jgi:hypothetical protein
MLQIMLACTHTGQCVPTSIETDVDTFMALPGVLSLTRCLRMCQQSLLDKSTNVDS